MAILAICCSTINNPKVLNVGLKQHLLPQNFCGAIWESSNWMLWLKVYHEVANKMMARAAVI